MPIEIKLQRICCGIAEQLQQQYIPSHQNASSQNQARKQYNIRKFVQNLKIYTVVIHAKIHIQNSFILTKPESRQNCKIVLN